MVMTMTKSKWIKQAEEYEKKAAELAIKLLGGSDDNTRRMGNR